MSKVITYSQKYPGYHPKKGKSTYFVEKFLLSTGLERLTEEQFFELETLIYGRTKGLLPEMIELYYPKRHTVRSGHRFKQGDYFSPRVWRGVPYQKCFDKDGKLISSQIIIGPDTLITKVFDIEIDWAKRIYINKVFKGIMGAQVSCHLAINDGLEKQDFIDWFLLSPDYKKENHFSGQIICWDKSIEY